MLNPRDGDNHQKLELYRDGIVKQGYSINPEPRIIEQRIGIPERIVLESHSGIRLTSDA